MQSKMSRRGLFGLFGGGSAVIAARALPIVEKVAPIIPKLWDTTRIGGRLHFWNGFRWERAYSEFFLVK